MSIAPAGSRQSRQERLRQLLDSEQSWRKRLAQDFEVRSYAFDSRLQTLDETAELTFDGWASSLRSSLETLASRLKGRPVAGVLLFSDGNGTDGELSNWKDLGVPVFPVVEAEVAAPADLRVKQVAVSQSDFEAAPIALSGRLEGDLGFAGKVVVQIQDAAGKVVQETKIAAPRDGHNANFSFRFRPEKAGVQFFRVVAIHEDDQPNFATGTSRYEATLANNIHQFVIDRGQGPFRVLYIAGRPNWEFKFLRRAIEEDPELQIVGLVRIAKKAPKFNFRDRGIEEVNPLFAGLGKSEEEVARQHDETVLIRLGVNDDEELRSGFPTESKELFAYHALVIDDLEASYFSEDQKLLIRRFVSSRGGGLIQLGGQEAMDGESAATTILGELSPVYFRSPTGDRGPDPVQMELTREGLLQPWLRLRTTQHQEDERLEKMPLFQVINPVGSAKPGAAVLATGRDVAGKNLPVLVTQRFGLGRSAALMVGDLWRWEMHRSADQPHDLGQAWRQLVRYLVTDALPRTSLRVTQNPDSSRPTIMEIMVRDEEFQPMDQVSLELKVTGPDGKSFTIVPEVDDRRAGVYLAECWSRDAGGYLATLTAKGEDGSEVGQAETGWTAQPAAAEFQRLSLHREALARIAEQSGGQVIPEEQLSNFVENWPADKVPVRETWEYPLWYRPWVVLAAIGLLCGEWGLRRWKGLP
jgi:hypothetical protein